MDDVNVDEKYWLDEIMAIKARIIPSVVRFIKRYFIFLSFLVYLLFKVPAYYTLFVIIVKYFDENPHFRLSNPSSHS